MDKKKPDADKKPAVKRQDQEQAENHQNAELPRENEDNEGIEGLPLKGIGLPDRDLKKNLGCG